MRGNSDSKRTGTPAPVHFRASLTRDSFFFSEDGIPLSNDPLRLATFERLPFFFAYPLQSLSHRLPFPGMDIDWTTCKVFFDQGGFRASSKPFSGYRRLFHDCLPFVCERTLFSHLHEGVEHQGFFSCSSVRSLGVILLSKCPLT